MSVITHSKFLAQLKRWQVPVVPYTRRGVPWYRHNRDYATFNPRGILVHDTVTGSMSAAAAAAFCWDGRSDVPGPLYVGLVAEDGKLHLIGWGLTNNAGMGAKNTLALVLADKMPMDTLHRPSTDEINGNPHYYGFAYVGPGGAKKGWAPSAAARRTMARTCAAICEAHDWSSRSIANHKEHTRRKIDAIDDKSGRIRRDVAVLLKNGPTKPPVVTKPPTTTTKPPVVTKPPALITTMTVEDLKKLIDSRLNDAIVKHTEYNIAWHLREILSRLPAQSTKPEEIQP